MPQESELLAQRRSNMDALAALGVDLYPHEFARTDTIESLVRAHGEKTKEELEAARVETTTSGRILAIRSFGKANFLVLSDGRARHPGVHPPGLGGRSCDFKVFKLLDLGDFVGVAGHLFRTKTNEFTIWASRLHVPGQVPGAAAGEVARPAGHRDPLPPALPRPHRQPGLAPRVRDAQPGARRDPRLPERARATSKSRRR